MISKMIKISAIICTHNNPILLKKAIKSLINQSLNKDKYEILVINNKSEDRADRTVQAYADRYSKVRYANEKKLGLSYARNKGVREARGDYIAFMDDDAEADIDWLSSIVRCFEQTNPRPDIIGGKVFLKHELDTVPNRVIL